MSQDTSTGEKPAGAPMLGDVVHYRLSADDATAINKRRGDHHNFSRTLGAVMTTGHIGHTGNSAYAGDLYAATVVRVFDEPHPTANLQVHLDGNDTYWATSRARGTENGQWLHRHESTPSAS